MSEIRVENIIGETGTDAVTFSKGLSTTGIVTATNVSVGSSVTATSFFGSGASLTGISAGITNAQQFRLAADQSGSGSAGTVLTNWQDAMTTYTAIGGNWSHSNGIFSCSVTGIYLCHWTFVVSGTNTGDAYDPNIQISQNSGSSYVNRSRTWGKVAASAGVHIDSPSQSFMFDVDNTSTFRLRYRESSGNDVSSGTTIAGSTSENLTNIMFIRLGDT
jgi:hypothetical protein